MATYYWVGGAGTWNTSTTTNWASSSGGAGGAGVPTSADDVIFDSASSAASYIVGIAAPNCKNLTATGPASGTLTFFSANSQAINCYGSVDISGNVATGSANGVLNLRATTTGNTLSFNGVSVFNGGRLINVVGVGGEWTLTSNCVSDFNHTNGTLITNGYSLNSGLFASTGTSTRSLTLGSSSISVSTIFTLSGSALTLDAGSSTIVATGALTTTSTGSNNWGTSSLTGGASSVIGPDTYYNVTITGSSSITGASTFNNLTINGPGSAGITSVTVTGNQTVSGTLTFSASALNQRAALYSATIGSAITFTVGTVSGLSNIDFRDITAAGSSSPWSTTSGCGDCGGNTNISSFPAAKTVYWNLAGSQSWSATAWAPGTGGTPNASNFPLAQDTAIIDNAGSAGTITFNASFNVKTIDFSNRTSAVTFTVSNLINIYGDFKLGSGVTYSGSGGIIFAGTATSYLTSAGKAILGIVSIAMPGGTLNINDAFTTTQAAAQRFYVIRGTFTTNNYNITTGGFLSNGSLSRTLNFGSSAISLVSTSGNQFVDFSGSNITLNAGTSSITINQNATNAVDMGTSLTFHDLTFTTNARSLTGNSITCNTLTTNTLNLSYSFITATSFVWNSSGSVAFTGASTNYTFNPTAASTWSIGSSSIGNMTVNNTVAATFGITLTGDPTISGTLTTTSTLSAGRTVILSNTAGTARTITAAAVSLSDTDFFWITGAGAATWIGTRLGNAGNSSGITFDVAKTVYWNLSGAQNINATGWATLSGGSPSASNFPLPQDTAVFNDSGSVTGNITMITGYYYPTIDMSSRTSAMTLVSAAVNFSGGLKLGTGTTISGTSAFTFVGNNAAPIQCSGKTLANALTFSKINGTATQQDAFLSSTTVTHNNGTYDAANYNFTASSFTSSNSNTRTLTMGSGTWSLTGTGTPWTLTTTTNLTFSGNLSTITYTNATASSTKIFAGGSLSYGGLSFGGGSAASQIFQITGSNSFVSLSHTKTVAFTIQFTAGTTTSIGSWNIDGTAGNLVTIGSVTTSSHILTKTGGGYVNANYLSISRSTATPSTATWFAGPNSTNGGNNSGWIFSSPPFGNFFMLWRG